MCIRDRSRWGVRPSTEHPTSFRAPRTDGAQSQSWCSCSCRGTSAFPAPLRMDRVADLQVAPLSGEAQDDEAQVQRVPAPAVREDGGDLCLPKSGRTDL